MFISPVMFISTRRRNNELIAHLLWMQSTKQGVVLERHLIPFWTSYVSRSTVQQKAASRFYSRVLWIPVDGIELLRHVCTCAIAPRLCPAYFCTSTNNNTVSCLNVYRFVTSYRVTGQEKEFPVLCGIYLAEIRTLRLFQTSMGRLLLVSAAFLFLSLSPDLGRGKNFLTIKIASVLWDYKFIEKEIT